MFLMFFTIIALSLQPSLIYRPRVLSFTQERCKDWGLAENLAPRHYGVYLDDRVVHFGVCVNTTMNETLDQFNHTGDARFEVSMTELEPAIIKARAHVYLTEPLEYNIFLR